MPAAIARRAIEAISDLVICVVPSELGFGLLFRWSQGNRAQTRKMFETAHDRTAVICDCYKEKTHTF
ncbi:MAG: hypothetical protein ACKOPC_09190, partial [Methylocystis sp.]